MSLQKSTMTMEELMEQLIKKSKLENEDSNRMYVSSLNGLAGKEFCTNLSFCVYLGYFSLVFCSRRSAATHLQPNLYHYLKRKDLSSLFWVKAPLSKGRPALQ